TVENSGTSRIRTSRIRAAQGSEEVADLGVELHEQALEQREKGHLRRALILARHALRFIELGTGTDSPDAANLGNSLSTLYQDVGRYSDAERVARRSVEIIEKYADDPDTDIQAIRAQSLDGLATVLRLQ